MKVLLKNKGGGSVIVNMDKNTQLWPHFKLWEVANNKGDTKDYQFILSPETDDFMLMIEQLRSWWNKPMTCNSCFRQVQYNKAVGGDPKSLHLQARAFDWGVNLTYQQRVAVCRQWSEICRRSGRTGGINFYTWGVHLDDHEDYYGYKQFVIRDGDKVVQFVPRP